MIQKLRYFKYYAKVLLNNWTVNKYSYAQQSEDKLIEILLPEGVHSFIDIGANDMRQGDFKDHYRGKHYLEDHDYKVFIHRLKKLFGNNFGIFVACEEIKDKQIDESSYFNYGGPAVNLYTLSKCNYLIGLASTFMTWAAFLNNIPTCYIDRTNFNSKDLVFKEFSF